MDEEGSKEACKGRSGWMICTEMVYIHGPGSLPTEGYITLM
jgi:hypothetical protein